MKDQYSAFRHEIPIEAWIIIIIIGDLCEVMTKFHATHPW
jgi:hypothetical protein